MSKISVLKNYASAFRQMINAKMRGSDKSIRQLLKLNNESDWYFLTAAMDIIDDASTAISSFQRFGISGPTKYDDLGEKYLRLYGILSATYIQQEAILKIHEILNLPNRHDAQKNVYALQIRKLRNKLSAHGTDYSNKEKKAKEAYVPLRFGLNTSNITAV